MSAGRRGYALNELPDVICPECGGTFRPQGIGRHRKFFHPETFVPTRNAVLARTRPERMERVRAAEARRAEASP